MGSPFLLCTFNVSFRFLPLCPIPGGSSPRFEPGDAEYALAAQEALWRRLHAGPSSAGASGTISGGGAPPAATSTSAGAGAASEEGPVGAAAAVSVRDYLLAELAELGLEASVFHFGGAVDGPIDSPEGADGSGGGGGGHQRCASVAAVVRAPRGDGKEGVALVTPLLPVEGARLAADEPWAAEALDAAGRPAPSELTEVPDCLSDSLILPLSVIHNGVGALLASLAMIEA